MDAGPAIEAVTDDIKRTPDPSVAAIYNAIASYKPFSHKYPLFSFKHYHFKGIIFSLFLRSNSFNF